MTIEQITTELKTKYRQVDYKEYDYLYLISVDGRQVKVKKSTMTGNKMPLTIKNLLK